MELVGVIVVLLLMMGADSWRSGGWSLVRPTTVIVRLLLLALGAFAVAFGRAVPGVFLILGGAIGCVIGIGLAYYSQISFRSYKDSLQYRGSWMLSLLPLVLVALRALIVGPAILLPQTPTPYDGFRSVFLVSLVDFLFIAYWFALYVILLIRGNRFVLDQAQDFSARRR